MNIDRWIQEDGKLIQFAFPGGYTVAYLDAHNHVLCPDCAQDALDDPDEFDDWKPKTGFINHEDKNCYCSVCNQRLMAGCFTEEEHEQHD